jgi:hypothetical protein
MLPACARASGVTPRMYICRQSHSSITLAEMPWPSSRADSGRAIPHRSVLALPAILWCCACLASRSYQSPLKRSGAMAQDHRCKEALNHVGRTPT